MSEFTHEDVESMTTWDISITPTLIPSLNLKSMIHHNHHHMTYHLSYSTNQQKSPDSWYNPKRENGKVRSEKLHIETSAMQMTCKAAVFSKASKLRTWQSGYCECKNIQKMSKPPFLSFWTIERVNRRLSSAPDFRVSVKRGVFQLPEMLN